MTTRRNDRPPLTARSVVASTLLGMQPPRLSGQMLVRSGELFGIAEGTTRVALTRMVTAGELEADDGVYRLSGRLLDRQARQDRSRHPEVRPWDGRWHVAVVVADARTAAERADLRRAAGEVRLAERREGVWVRPDNVAIDFPAEAAAVLGDQCEVWTAEPDRDPSALAAALWDLGGWAAGAADLIAEMAEHRAALDARSTGALAPGFLTAAAVLRHLLADPLLPEAALPAGWPGSDIRAAYDSFQASFSTTWNTWYWAQRT